MDNIAKMKQAMNRRPVNIKTPIASLFPTVKVQVTAGELPAWIYRRVHSFPKLLKALKQLVELGDRCDDDSLEQEFAKRVLKSVEE